MMDDGARVYVDNTLMIDAWQTGKLREITGDMALTAGAHVLRVEYFEATLEAAVYFWWDDGTVYPDWRGEYWPNQTLTGLPTLVHNDQEVNFRWEFGSPDPPGIPDDHFSARWARFQDFRTGHLSTKRHRGRRCARICGRQPGAQSLVQSRCQRDPLDRSGSGRHARHHHPYYEDRDLASIRFWIDRIGDVP